MECKYMEKCAAPLVLTETLFNWRDAKKKDYLCCVSKLPFRNTKKATLITRRRLVRQKRCKNERQVATPPYNFRTRSPWCHGFWNHLLEPSLSFFLLYILKEPKTERRKSHEFLLNHKSWNAKKILYNPWCHTHIPALWFRHEI